MDNDIRIPIITECISSEVGWRVLAKDIKDSRDPCAKLTCLALLHIIAGDQKIEVDGVTVSYYDSLTSQLEKYLKE